ncbi:MFS transporter [Candidatus Uhrbacteria bacterium]|nr:MFS transporter [Candidatus Uhrbacteria bacterium]
MSATRIYYTFSALIGMGLGATVTVYVPFLLSIGLTLGQVALVNALFWAVIIVSELPTGMLADGRSRAYSLKAGAVFHAIGGLSYLLASGIWGALFSEGLIAIGMAFLSGAQQAWIADALEREGRAGQLRHVFATETIIKAALFIIGGLGGSLLALISYRLIWVPVIVTSLAAVVFGAIKMDGQGEPLERIGEWEAFAKSWQHLRGSRALKWVVGALILFGAVVSFNHFWTPYFQLKVGTLGLSWVWAIIYLTCLPAGLLVRRLPVKTSHEAHHIVLALLLTGLGLLLIPLTGGLLLSIGAVMIHEFGRGLFQPLTDAFVHHRVSSSYRATFGSLQSLFGRVGFAVVPLVVWITIRDAPNTPGTIGTVWIVCGSFLLVGSVFFFLWRIRETPPSLDEAPKDD